jgi:hypothetical protein
VLSTCVALAATDCVFTDRMMNVKHECTAIMPKKENMTPTDEHNFAYTREIQVSIFCRQNHDEYLVRQFCSHPYQFIVTSNCNDYKLLILSIRRKCAGIHLQNQIMFSAERIDTSAK